MNKTPNMNHNSGFFGGWIPSGSNVFVASTTVPITGSFVSCASSSMNLLSQPLSTSRVSSPTASIPTSVTTPDCVSHSASYLTRLATAVSTSCHSNSTASAISVTSNTSTAAYSVLSSTICTDIQSPSGKYVDFTSCSNAAKGKSPNKNFFEGVTVPSLSPSSSYLHLNRLESDPHNAQFWRVLLAENPSFNAFEKALEFFPMTPIFWQMYAEFAAKAGNIESANSIFGRCLDVCPHIDLWMSYVKFIYQFSSAQNYLSSLCDAVEKVGYDYRSGPLWMELLILKIKIYNTSIIKSGGMQGMLMDPYKMDGSNDFHTVLIPSEAEQKFFEERNNSDKSLIEEHSEINKLRRFYHDFLSTATANSKNAWFSYCQFERSSGGNSSLANKFVTEYENKILDIVSTYNQLCKLHTNLNPHTPAVPINETNAKEMKMIFDQWHEIILYEKTNPLKLSDANFIKRMIFTYQLCLLHCAYNADIWFEFFQFLISCNYDEKAIAVLRCGIDRFLPNDELLKIILANFLEENNQINDAEDVYLGVIFREDGINGEKEEQSSTNLTATIINYLGFVRRNYDADIWEDCFDRISKLHNCSWEVYVYFALAQWRCRRNKNGALRIWKLAMQKYWLHECLISAYANFLLDISNLKGAESILLKGIIDIHREQGIRSSLLWTQWTQLVHRYGNKEQMERINTLRTQQREVVDIEEELLCGQQKGSNSSKLPVTFDNAVCFPHSKNSCSSSSSIHPGDIYQKIVSTRLSHKRQFAAGDSLRQLRNRYSFATAVPFTCITDVFFERSNSLEDDYLENEDGDSEGTEEEKWNSEYSKLKATRRQVVRPDVTKMTSFKPMLTTLSSQTISRNVDNAPSDLLGLPAGTASAASLVSFKALHDFLCILPQTRTLRQRLSLCLFFIKFVKHAHFSRISY